MRACARSGSGGHMQIASWNVARVCAVAALIGACGTSNDGDDTNGQGSGGSSAPGMTNTGSGGATPMGDPGSNTGNPAMQTGSGGMGSSTSHGSGGSNGGRGQDGDSADHDADGGALSDGGGGDATAPMHEDLGMGDGKDVVTIGDSWMQLYVAGIEESLDKASGQTYRHYAVPGTLVLDEVIPNQYESAKMENPDIKTVVMTGGGNDILTTNCADEACNSIVDMVSDRLTMLMQEMGKDGVQDIVLIGYTYPDDTSKRESLDYSIMLNKMFCKPDSMPRCHSLDSTQLDITLRDGIHPDDAGYDLIGETVWQMMQDQGMRR
jgi:hypothetical protein